MRVRRGDVRDAVYEDGRAAVYVDDQVIVLSEMATVILDTVQDNGTARLDDITQVVLDEFGPPPRPGDAAEMTRNQVLDLIAHGVLVDDDPIVATAPTQRSTEALKDALRHLRSSDHTRWQIPEDVTPGEFLASGRQHHVTSLVAHHIDRLVLPSDLESALRMTTTRTDASVRLLAGELGRALDALDRAGVRALAIKGLALSAQAYGDSTVRGAGDLDLVVPPADVATAHKALVEAGWRHDPAHPIPGSSWAWRHALRTGYELTLESDTSVVDLHWHLSPMKSTCPSFDDLWKRREVLNLGHREVSTLSRYDALAHSAAHSAKDEWRWMRSLVDVHALASDSRTWHADRPLRHDELVTLGLSVLALGRPDCAPPVVDHAVRLAQPYWDDSTALHLHTLQTHVSPATPGTTLIRTLRGSWRSRSAITEVPRVLSRSLLPTWLTVDEPSTTVLVAAPRVMARRIRLMIGRLARSRGGPQRL
ncbi:nucleotidyltransferase family protein [Nocardioides terrigena]|uniref:nucleotidyltransferase family protein n=1 Tax=Nocardioides terrigena TaxID=424797 RepID=UPI000D314F0A|nr:nucleotidyltransferase family protein [Nocardioides terrigena]